MQNSFEKNVQQKMEELKLTPSAQVWEKVEAEIQVEKKRRRGLLWFSFAGLLLAGAAWLHQAANKEATPGNKQAAGQPHGVSTNERTEQKAPQEKENAISKQQGNVLFNAKTGTVKSEVQLHQKKRFARAAALPSLQKEVSFQTSTKASVLRQASAVTKEDVPFDLPELPSASTQKMEHATTIPATSFNAQTTTNAPLLRGPDSVAKQKDANKTVLPLNVDSTVKKKVAAVYQWQKQLVFNAGWSSLRQGSTATLFGPMANYASSPTQSGYVLGRPSPTTKGFFFSLGFSVAKKINSHWEIGAGLQYTCASTHQKLGDKKQADTLVQFAADKVATTNFYTNAATNIYTTHFHFVEIPVSLSLKPSLRLPLYVSVGAAYGRLLSTNALTFSAASNLYYRNKENDVRNSLAAFSSAQVELFGKRKTSLRTGPFLQCNLLKLQKENNGSVPHLLFAGLKTTVIF